MPEMDGFKLLAHLSNNYSDIPVIIQTACSSPQFKRAVLEGGAVEYIEKPFKVDELALAIITILQNELECETIQSIPLDLFINLIKMENKTCTIRIEKKSTEEQGILFFRKGDLLDARIQQITYVSALSSS